MHRSIRRIWSTATVHARSVNTNTEHILNSTYSAAAAGSVLLDELLKRRLFPLPASGGGGRAPPPTRGGEGAALSTMDSIRTAKFPSDDTPEPEPKTWMYWLGSGVGTRFQRPFDPSKMHL